MRFEGVIKTWNDERGFGFIEPRQGGQELFVHIKAFNNLQGRPQVQQPVTFEVELGPQGKKRAVRVALAQPRRVAGRAVRRDAPAQWGTATLFAIPAFLVVVLAAHLLGRPPRWTLLLYLGASVVTFSAYAFDKAAARRGGRRTSEATLHMLSLLGGWPGALVAHQFLRHKSVKAEFRSAFWGTVLVNVLAFTAMASPLAARLQ